MENRILTELSEIKDLLSRITGTAQLDSTERFSIASIEKAAKEFKDLEIRRGEWIEDHQITKCIKSAPYRAGAFIRQEFGFTNAFKRGSTWYFNKQDLLALAKELKERNVDLSRYMELKEDKAKFEKSLASIPEVPKGKKKNPFKLARDAKNVPASPSLLPTLEQVREELKALKQTFFSNNYKEYIDIYKGNYAMLKHMYYMQKYIEQGLRRKLSRWCQEFNDANHIIAQLSKKKEVFILIEEKDMITL